MAPKRLLLSTVPAVLLAACLIVPALGGKTEEGFKPLFNGKDLTGWTTEGNWVVEDGGVLAIKPREGEEGWKRFEDYLYTKKKYGDFVLKLEYKLKEGGNSGVFFRIGDREEPVDKGIELQILDSYGTPDEEMTAHDCGGIIRTAAPSTNAAKPAGEWNEVKIALRGDHLKAWLNGKKIQDLSLEGTPVEDRPDRGYISLQDHGLNMWFRNIRIKTLD